ncbi:MAG: ABC transporter ATP-binding protein [Ruminiclostridium sp.]
MKKAVVEFKNYTFKYRTQVEPTIYDINLKVYEGEKLLIAGPSGSGKSTLANCINGLVPHSYSGESEGFLEVMGLEPKELGLFGLSKLVGTVLQDTDSQFIGLTVGEDIAFALENDCVAQQEMIKKVDSVAKMVDVASLLEQSPQELSGGQKQRVSIAGVLVDDVNILLFDEPLANLDPATGKYAMELIDRIHRETNTTIIIIEHRLEDVLHCEVDRIIVMDEGRIVADTIPAELLSSDVLKENGIREPLYITCLKYANCGISPSDNPENINTIVLDNFSKRLREWFENTKISSIQPETLPVLELQNINFSYQMNKTVLSDISFSIKKGEMISIIGKNGAGKTSLSKLICGFEKAYTGSILLNGRNIEKDSITDRAEKIGVVMQNPNHMISKPMIYDEVALGLVSRGWSSEEIKQQVEKTLKTCGLYPFRNWPISALSYGQKKRVTIASILVLNPQIIILDEPTAGQDFKHYTEFMEFLLKLNKENKTTIIMITHDMHLILEYTTRAIVMSDGHIIANDTPAAVLTNDAVINKANLKRTSLYDLAVRVGINESRAFVQHFIDFDRSVRE